MCSVPLEHTHHYVAAAGGECVEDNDRDVWHVSNAVRHGLLGAEDTIIMLALHPVVTWFAGTFVLKQGSSAATISGLLLMCTGVV